MKGKLLLNHVEDRKIDGQVIVVGLAVLEGIQVSEMIPEDDLEVVLVLEMITVQILDPDRD